MSRLERVNAALNAENSLAQTPGSRNSGGARAPEYMLASGSEESQHLVPDKDMKLL